MFTVNIQNKTLQLDERTPILSVIDDPAKTYYVAKVNNRLRELNYELCYDANVELLDLTNADAVKVYETSLRYLIAHAFHNLYPDYQIKICYAISRSLMVTVLSPKVQIDKAMLKAVKKEMDRLVAANLPFEKMMMSKEDAYDYFISQGQTDKAETLRYRPEKTCHFYKCAE